MSAIFRYFGEDSTWSSDRVAGLLPERVGHSEATYLAQKFSGGMRVGEMRTGLGSPDVEARGLPGYPLVSRSDEGLDMEQWWRKIEVGQADLPTGDAEFRPSPAGLEGSVYLRDFDFSEIAWGCLRFRLNEGLCCEAYRDQDLYIIRCQALGIHAFAQSWHEVKQELMKDFVALWQDYGLARDEELAPSGLALKRRLRGLVAEEVLLDEA